MIQRNGDPAGGGTDLEHGHSVRLLELATDRFLARMALQPTALNAIAIEIAEYAQVHGLVFPESILQGADPDLDALKWLLDQPVSIRTSMLERGLHRAIQLLSTEASFHAAVERSARRQVYHLAYGLTHEINNPLANIVARAQKLLGDVSDPFARKSLATIMDQGMRAAEMLAEAMRAVQPAWPTLVATDIGVVVRDAWLNLQDRAREAGVQWECALGSEPILADAHRPSLLDALRMLGLNSIDACRPTDSIHWSCETLGHGPNARIRITLSDTGPGLTPLAQRSALDLYFSGREHGRGLGISLALVRRIVEMHRGTFAIYSEAGAGCRTEMELPCTHATMESRPTIRL